MSCVLAWLRQLDRDALGGRMFTRRAVLFPLSLVIGLLVGGGVGFLAGVYLGLARTPEPITYNIGLPYVSSIVGALGAAGLGLSLSLRATRSCR
jgi:hypothetical protein